MHYFDKLYRRLISEQDTLAGIGPSTTGGAGLGSLGAGGAPMTTTPPSNPPLASTLPKSDKDPSQTALQSQKKLQIAKLIALSLLTPIGDTHTDTVHKIRAASSKPVVQGNAEDQEKMIIKAIALIQGDKTSDILDQIKYIPANTNDETSTNYIAPDEYASLINLARSALITSPNNIGGSDRADINTGSINVNNVEQKIQEFQNLLSQSI